MSRKYTLDEVVKIVDSFGYKLISKEYIDNKQRLVLKDFLGYYCEISLSNLFSKNRNPVKFGCKNSYTIQNIKLWCKLNDKPFVLISTIFIGARNKLKWKCSKDNCTEEFELSWTDVHMGYGCPFCTGRKVGNSNCLATKNPELAKEWHPTKNGDLTPYDVTCSSHKRVWWQCKECGYEWDAVVYSRNSGKGCSECNKSNGEKECKRFFDLFNIYYIRNKEFINLYGVGNGNLSYDFYLPEQNLLIEYQGIQHEKYIKGFHKSKNEFETQQEHDKRKREYADKNNIKLLEIWYWDFDNIESILEKEVLNFDLSRMVS